jgi:hypothetical protein
LTVISGRTLGNGNIFILNRSLAPCYDATVFNFGKPKTVGDWIVHLAGAIVAIFLVWWMFRVYV